MKSAIKRMIVSLLPLALRKRLAIWINRQTWFDSKNRAYWATELLTDFAAKDVNSYHKFLWQNHLAYAETYDIQSRYGFGKLNETRRLLFSEMPTHLAKAGIQEASSVRSIFEVGCSLGYLLRYIETDLFPEADRIEGIDIDILAISEGSEYLRRLGSKIVLHHGDMESIDGSVADSKFDLVLASGVLLYLDEVSATRLVATMLKITGKLLVITALAFPDCDNSELTSSVQRASDGTWIHNVDRMIVSAGGSLVHRRWQQGLVDGNTIYFLYAVPAFPDN